MTNQTNANTDKLLRGGLSYAQARANCNRKSSKAHADALEAGKTQAEAEAAGFAAYEAEMRWYES